MPRAGKLVRHGKRKDVIGHSQHGPPSVSYNCCDMPLSVLPVESKDRNGVQRCFRSHCFEKLRTDGKLNGIGDTKTRPRVVINNYAKLSKTTTQKKNYKKLDQMNGSLDMIVLDELHMVKLRKNPSSGCVEAADSDSEESAHGKEIDEELGDSIEPEKALKLKDDYLSRRRKVVLNVVTRARKANPKIRTLGLTATPVVNNLKEAQSLLCIVSGKDFSHLNCPNKPTLDDVMAVHRELHIHGTVFCPNTFAKPVEGLGANEQIDATQEYMHMYKEIEKSKGAMKRKRKRMVITKPNSL